MIESPPNELFLLLLSIKTETRAAIKSDLNQRAALVALSSLFLHKIVPPPAFSARLAAKCAFRLLSIDEPAKNAPFPSAFPAFVPSLYR
jgi:hypothetical protein